MLRNLLTLPLCLLFVGAFSQSVKFDEWKNLTSSGKLPKECKIQHSNNNLDLVKYHGKYYLAFRTAPVHFPSGKTVMYVISSTDLDNWKYETEINLHCDLREPKFAVYHDTLNLYCFTGAKSMFKFDPREILQIRTTGDSKWTTPASVHLDGFVPWRIRERNDTLYLSAYYGKHLYGKSHQSNLRLFASTDAANWQPITEQPQVDIFSAEEGEFIFDKAGDLYATVRLEGSGALVCSADKTAIGNWKKVRTKTKYDSALFFANNDDLYLISRRNLDGDIDKVKNRKNEKQGRARNLIRYSITRKVTSLFKLNKKDLTLSLVSDFPTTGDNAFPGITQVDSNTYVVMNYSSDYNKRKKNWIQGQLGKTYIYYTTLRFQQP
jgi:hypothetical protein